MDVRVIRSVEIVDFMTATWTRLPKDFLVFVSNPILNELGGMNRAIYDISIKSPAIID